MESKRIEELLNRYWNCETSLEEEAQLREYFQGGTIPEEHKEAAALFRYFHNSRNTSVDVDFKPASQNKEGKVVTFVKYSLRIAAGVSVLVVASWFIKNEMDKQAIAEQRELQEQREIELAFEQTKKALMMISENFGKAEQEAKKINLFNKAQEEIQKGTKQ
jgi:hypothetical protein